MSRGLSFLPSSAVRGEYVTGTSMIRDLWDLGDLTQRGVQADSERDPSVLAERNASRAGASARARPDPASGPSRRIRSDHR